MAAEEAAEVAGVVAAEGRGGGGGGGGGGPPAAPLMYALVTTGARGRVPYLSGAFAGRGGFTVSPILGYQGGLNSDGTQTTTSRQFQAGLSVTGKGAAQNATLFVMTSQISNAPNAGFTQAGGFTGVTVRNPAGWFGLASGSVSSAKQGSSPNTVSTVNGTPIAGFTLNNANTNLNTGVVTNSVSSNFVKPGGTTTYTFDPVSAGTPTYSASNHPNLTLNGYVGGIMLTATGGTRGAPANFTKPYVVTNLTGTPGDVGVFLPGDLSEMLAVFNVKGVTPPTGGMANSNYVFGSLDADSRTGLNGARGAYVNPSNFAGRAAAIYDNGANIPISARDGTSLSRSGGFATQQMVTAESVGANTSSFLTSISSTTVTPCKCESHSVGFLERLQRRNQQQRSTRVRGSGEFLLWVAGVPTSLGLKPSCDRDRHLHGPRDRQYRQPEQHHQLSRRRHIYERGQFRRLGTARAPLRSTASTERTMPARSIGSLQPRRSRPSRR